MDRQALMALGMVCIAASGCSGGASSGKAAGCTSATDCASGEICVSGTCAHLCNSATNCASTDTCIAGVCQPRSPECQTDSDCTTPSPCELRTSAHCNAGVCDYQPVTCQQTAPINPCLARTAQCNPTLQQGTCTGTDCCAYPSVVTAGSSGPAPACPLSGQDPNGNGRLDSGEQWTGSCTSTGTCKAPQGTACTVASDCTTDLCEDGYCCDSTCSGNCERCDLAGSQGTCTPDPTVCTGSCATCGADGNCTAAASTCSGDCATCQQASATEFDCAADPSQCTALCTSCSGSSTSFSCAYDASRSATDCSAGYECSAPGSCLASVGTSCSSPADCAGDLLCSGSPATCLSPDGDACTSGAQCAGGGCTPTGVCCGNSGPCWLSITAGDSDACAVPADGSVWCWGRDYAGQLGDDDPNLAEKTTPVQVTGLSNVVSVSAGSAHVCALLGDHTIRCWGSDSAGQLGDSADLADQYTPVPVSGLSNVVALSAGGAFTCAVRQDGTVWCWGADNVGQLGDGDPNLANKPLPAEVSTLTGATAVAAGSGHACAVTSGGKAYCWGSDGVGELGNNTTSASQSTPVLVAFSNGANAVSIAAGSEHTCAVTDSGAIDCWGSDGAGQLGDNATTNQSTPTPTTFNGSALVLAAGGAHTCVVLTNGTAQCWGNDNDGQLGNNSNNPATVTVPVGVLGVSTAYDIAAAQGYSCAAISGGRIDCWGFDGAGQLGNGRTQPIFQLVPVPVAFGKKGVGEPCSSGDECATQMCIDPLSSGNDACWYDGEICSASANVVVSSSQTDAWVGQGQYTNGQFMVSLSVTPSNCGMLCTTKCSTGQQPGTTLSGCSGFFASYTGVSLVLDNTGCHLQDSTGADLATGAWH